MTFTYALQLLQIIPRTIKLQNFLNKEILKISLIFNNEDELDKYFLLLNKENASISKSAKKHIEITAKGVDKAFGYRKLIGKLGIDMNKSISILIGNGDNDIPISNEVDISYSVANSSTEYRNKAEYALAKNNGEALLGLVNAINKNQDFGRKVDLSKPKLLDIINEDMEIVSIGQPVARVHKCSSLHLSVCIIFENINGDILCRLKKNKFNDLKSLYCCPYNFHIPSVYTVDRAINQFVKNFKGNFKEVRKLGFKHIKNGDENEICHFFTAKVIEDKKTFESRIYKWCSEKILKERIEKKKVTKYLKTYYLLKTLR